MDSEDYQELNGIGGEPVDFEWDVSPGHTTLGLLHEIRRKIAQNGIKTKRSKDRIIFTSMYNDIDWSQGDENFKMCVSNYSEVQAYAHRFPKDIDLFSERTRTSPKVRGTAQQK